jgi:hypothetical protein
MLNDITYDLPNGPGNLATLFPEVDFKIVEEYYLELFDDDEEIILTTPVNFVSKEWVAPSFIRIHFLNYCGRFDSISYHLYTKTDEVKSNQWVKALSHPLAKTDGGIQKGAVRAKHNYQAKHNFYNEAAHIWLEELLESSICFMELQSTEGQASDYVPVVITDKSTVTKKEEGRYVYETTYEFTLANERIGLKI